MIDLGISVRKAARRIGCDPSHVRKLLKVGQLCGYRDGRRIRVRESVVDYQDVNADRIEAYRAWQPKQSRLVWVKSPGPEQLRAGAARRGEQARQGPARSPQTANHYVKALRAILRRAARSIDPATRRPCLAVPPIVPLDTVPKRLPRPLTAGEINAVRGELAPPVADALELCLQFGLRNREAQTLEVADIDLEQGGMRLRAERTEGRRDEFLPASPAGLELIRRLVAQAERDRQAHFMPYRGPQGIRSAPERKDIRKQQPGAQ